MIIDLKTEEMEVSSISPPSSQSLSLICTTNGSTFVPVVYRPPRLITHYHQLKLNKADRLQWWKETYRKGLNDESYEIYKRECKRVKVKVEKLSDEIYAQHCPPQPRTSERQRLMAARRAQSYRCCNDDHHTHDHQPRRKRAKPPLLSSPVRSVTASIALNVKRRTFGMTTLRKRNQFKSLTSCDDNVKGE